VVTPYIASQEFRDALRRDLPKCLELEQGTSKTVREVQEAIARAVQDGHVRASERVEHLETFAALQKAEVARQAKATLESLGFEVQPAIGQTDSLWAERAHQRIALEVHSGGGFEFDMAGLEDDRCLALLNDFNEGMRKRGISYQMTRYDHADPRGGNLIRRVQSATAPAPAVRAPGAVRPRLKQ
jgi:hypothetical protein